MKNSPVRPLAAALAGALMFSLVPEVTVPAQMPPDRWLVPAEVRQAILEEFCRWTEVQREKS